MELDLELAASYLSLVDEWSYARAARVLHVSTPALTKRIQRLERQLGVTLVERGPTGVVGLTTAGLLFADEVRPVLEHARAAALHTRSVTDRCTLRVGVPAGTGQSLQFIGTARIEPELRREFPPARVVCLQVPFPAMYQCLTESVIDVLITIAPVRHHDIESIPLPLNTTRIGAVSARHVLADAAEVDVHEFCRHRLLHNPELPEEWMRPFWFADVRGIEDARLVVTHGSTNPGVQHDALAGTVAMVTLEPDRQFLPIGLRAVTITGAQPIWFYVARRRADRRAVVQAYVKHLQGVGHYCLTSTPGLRESPDPGF